MFVQLPNRHCACNNQTNHFTIEEVTFKKGLLPKCGLIFCKLLHISTTLCQSIVKQVQCRYSTLKVKCPESRYRVSNFFGHLIVWRYKSKRILILFGGRCEFLWAKRTKVFLQQKPNVILVHCSLHNYSSTSFAVRLKF